MAKKNIPAPSSEEVKPLDLNNLGDEIDTLAPTGDGWKVIDQKELTILGQTLEVRFCKNGAYKFGPEKPAMERVFLSNEGPCFGFVNATSYLKDGKYKVVKPGFHAKFDLNNTNYIALEDAYYVNLDILRDQQVAAFLASWNIVPEQHDWNVGHVFHRKVVAGHVINPMPKDDVPAYAALVEREKKAKKEGVDPNTLPLVKLAAEDLAGYFKANEKAWDQLNLHEGIELVLDALRGDREITVALRPNPGFESQVDFLRTRVLRLWGTAEERQAAFAEGMKNIKQRERTQRGGFGYNHKDELRGLVNNTIAKAGGVHVFVESEGKLVEVQPEDLVKASIYYRDAETKDKLTSDFFKTPAEARFATARAIADGKEIVVRKWALAK